jgi:hypothetical protein
MTGARAEARGNAGRAPGVSTTLRFLLGLAVLWGIGWGIASYFVLVTARSVDAELEAVLAMPSGVLPGEDSRIRATIAPGPTGPARYSGKTSLVSFSRLSVTGSYEDSGGRTQHTSMTAAERRSGPSTLGLETERGRVEIDVAWWSPTMDPEVQQVVSAPPPSLGITDREVAAAREKLLAAPERVTYHGLRVEEWTLAADGPAFVVGRVEEHAGQLRILPSAALGKVIFAPETEEAFVEDRRWDAKGLRIMAFVFLGLSIVPLAIVLLVVARRRSRPMRPAH